jgi:hypothetical protein
VPTSIRKRCSGSFRSRERLRSAIRTAIDYADDEVDVADAVAGLVLLLDEAIASLDSEESQTT